jgi:serine/threonine protein kinase
LIGGDASRVGPYQIDRRLGSGGMGQVYFGRDERSGALAAVKVIRAERAANPVLRERLRREVATARRVGRRGLTDRPAAGYLDRRTRST